MDKGKKNHEVLIKVICVLISFGLWLYISNVDNPTVTKTIKDVPVNITNQDSVESSKLIVMPNQDFKVNIEVQGTAAEVYSLKSTDFELSADLSYYALKKGDNNIMVNVDKSPSTVTIKRTDSLKVTVNLDELEEKTLPITSDIKVTAKSGSYPSVPVIDPSNAYISGAATYVDQVESVVASGEASDVENDVAVMAKLVALDKNGSTVKNVTISPVTANVIVPIKKGKTVPVNVITKGSLNSNLLLKSMEPSPSSVEITGDENTLASINSIDTEEVNLSLITNSKSIMQKLKLPNGVSLVNNSTGTVKISFDIEGIVQKSITVPIEVSGTKDGLKASLDNESITITVQGPADAMDGISDLKGTIDASNMSAGTTEIVPNIELPNGVTLVSMSPAKVNVTLEKQ